MADLLTQSDKDFFVKEIGKSLKVDVADIVKEANGDTLKFAKQTLAPEFKNIEKRITLRSRIENRTDDSLEVIRTRIIKYNNETKPIVQFYRSKYPLIFFELNGDQKIGKIHSDIINNVKKC